MIIAHKLRVVGTDGEELGYRTAYYRWYNGKHAAFGEKPDAVDVSPEDAQRIVQQLVALGYRDFKIISRMERLSWREPKPLSVPA